MHPLFRFLRTVRIFQPAFSSCAMRSDALQLIEGASDEPQNSGDSDSDECDSRRDTIDQMSSDSAIYVVSAACACLQICGIQLSGALRQW